MPSLPVVDSTMRLSAMAVYVYVVLNIDEL